MPIKLQLDANKIFIKEFNGTKPGYDAEAVDTFLDIVIGDYNTMEAYITDNEQKIKDLSDQVKGLTDANAHLTATNASLATKFQGINTNQDADLNNLELLKRIAALEKALSKAGINPNTIK